MEFDGDAVHLGLDEERGGADGPQECGEGGAVRLVQGEHGEDERALGLRLLAGPDGLFRFVERSAEGVVGEVTEDG